MESTTLNAEEVSVEQANEPESNELTENNASKQLEEIKETISDNTDPYAYLQNPGFTSEKFKIEIRNLPKFYGMKELRKLLNNKLDLKTNKIKTPSRGSHWAYVCFKSEEDKVKAIEKINGFKWKGNVLSAESAKAIPDPLVKKRLHDLDSQRNKKFKSNGESQADQVKNAVTPLWKLPYEEQLVKKKENIIDILKKLSHELAKANPDITNWLSEQTLKHNGSPCEVWPICHAELTSDGYRNKCEFSIGINEITGEKTIGFRLGSYSSGSICVAPIEDIPHVPNRMKEAVSMFQDFIRSSKLDVFNPETHQGYWKQLTSRYSFKTDQLMFVVHLQEQSLTDSELKNLEEELVTFFSDGSGKSCQLTSLYLQLMKKEKSEGQALHHLMGDKHIREVLLNRTFRISPQTFFQINTAGAEILYNSIAELSCLSEESTLLDVCCGSGSIGISLSDKCGEVLGLEILPEAVADAEVNASINKIENAQFFAGKAEEILSAVASKATKQEIIAVVDPPRAGLHHNALVQIRKAKQINKLVYVSCNPRLALKDFVDLCRPISKVYHREPFLPVKAVPVDLFPHTNHCELLIYFERSPES